MEDKKALKEEKARKRIAAQNKERARQTAEVIKMCDEWDNDLVQVSSHDNTCELCAKYQGKVFSIHGKTPGFPLFEKRPPFHSGCRHSINPTSLNALKWREINGEGK